MKITQGAIRVNDCRVIARNDDLVALSIDLHSKYAELASMGSDDGVPLIMLAANEYTLQKHKTKVGFTILEFDDYKGFEVFAATVSRYTARVCLVRSSAVGG